MLCLSRDLRAFLRVFVCFSERWRRRVPAAGLCLAGGRVGSAAAVGGGGRPRAKESLAAALLSVAATSGGNATTPPALGPRGFTSASPRVRQSGAADLHGSRTRLARAFDHRATAAGSDAPK